MTLNLAQRSFKVIHFGALACDISLQLAQSVYVPLLRSRMTAVAHSMTVTGMNSRAPMNTEAMISDGSTTRSPSSDVITLCVLTADVT